MRGPTFLTLFVLLDLTFGSEDPPLEDETLATVDLCTPNKCKIHETCIIKDGVAVCEPKFSGTCLIMDKKVKMFDGSIQDFPGNCPCVLAKSDGDNNGLEPFTVVLRRTRNRRSRREAAEDRVDLHVYNYTVSASSNLHGKLQVNDVLNNLPISLDNGKITASTNGVNTEMKTNFGLYVAIEEKWYTELTLPNSYLNRAGGLCGNF